MRYLPVLLACCLLERHLLADHRRPLLHLSILDFFADRIWKQFVESERLLGQQVPDTA